MIQNDDTTEALLMTPADAAKALAISPRTLWDWTAKGLIPSLKIGTRMVRYRRVDIEAWVERQMQEKGS